ncbi:MAG: hypothetical protein ABEJ44_04000 [Halanaeroarchaeum sp.]
MEVGAIEYLVTSVVGGLGLFAVWYLITRVRDWPYPVRTTEFHIERDPEVAKRAADRGPSGEANGDTAAEAVDRGEQSLWDRLKLRLYTYPERPKKVK